ncbi:hypothetical protein [Nitrospirillum bahiense]|uniref:Uncharacterized protein n=1 Tax=Nitrospirillum amazonense TaxID=28077 RepID=A0A560FC73_9PROT|nr:hypothetical protein [Nitrospirillum amazonense]TWB19211.1 hypothetical protein FBZ88_12266 [Nitrospirillum amazonense]
MGAPSLSPIAPRLVKLIPLLGSDQPGEVVATAAAIGRTLAGAGLTWHDVVAALDPSPGRLSQSARAAHPNTRVMAETLWRCQRLTEWEQGFVGSVLEQLKQVRGLSDRQVATLRKIYTDRFAER